MNILPKKRWHVRNKDNIARVRRDEAKANQEKLEKEQRQKFAEREARTSFLREKAKVRVGSSDFLPLQIKKEEPILSKHINFFQELEDGHEESNRTNKEHEREKKEESEKYEKQIGYLTYLGQDTNEALGKKNWYEEFPFRQTENGEEVNMKVKLKNDPLEIMKKYLPPSNFHKNVTTPYKVIDNKIENKLLDNTKVKKKKKKHKSRKRCHNSGTESSDDLNQLKCKKQKMHKRQKHKSKYNVSKSKLEVSDESEETKKKKIEILRHERFKREENERRRSDSLLSELKAKSSQNNLLNKSRTRERRYNSQFNPEIARQNFS